MNRSKQKGTAWETAVVRFLNDHGYPYAERRALRGTKDCGDISGVIGWVVECKAEKQISLSSYMDEVECEITNAAVPFGLAVVKRRNRPVGDAYAVMTLDTFAAHESGLVVP